MGLSYEEQETVITYDRAGKTMNVYTADKYLLARLMKLDTYKLVREYRQDGEVVAADFEADKKLVMLRPKVPKRELTEEQREANRENLRKARAARIDSE